MTLRIGFLGAGLISRMHGALLRASPIEHTITAVHDPDTARAAKFAERYGAEPMTEAAVLDSVDAVYVTTWTSEHARLVRAAADRGIAVFCEKPLAASASETEAMIEAAERAGIVTQVGFALRFVPQFIFIQKLLGDDRAGRSMAVSFRDDQYIPNQGAYASTWRTDPTLAGRGALLEHSIHDVDALRWLGGPIDTVSAVVREFHDLERIDDVAVARLEFAHGGVAALTSVWHDMLERPSLRRIEFFCERLHVVIDDEHGDGIRWQFAGSAPESLTSDALVTACQKAGLAPTTDVASLLGRPIFNSASAFLASVRGETRPILPFREALVTHRLIDALYASAERGGAAVATPEPESGLRGLPDSA